MPSPPRLLVHAALIGVSVLFGINFVGMKIVLGEVPASAWALVRIAAGTAFLAPLAWFLRPAWSRPSRRILLALVPAAILGVGGNQLLFALGLHRTTPAHASVITAAVLGPMPGSSPCSWAGMRKRSRRSSPSCSCSPPGSCTQAPWVAEPC